LRIEITDKEKKKKLIKNAEKMKMSATQFVCFLIEHANVEIQKKILIEPPSISFSERSFLSNRFDR